MRNTPGNTNWNVFEQLGGSGSSQETWPKLLHVIFESGAKIIADDSDFSSFSEAYNFIKNKWVTGEQTSSDYVILKFENLIVDTGGYVHEDHIEWYCDDGIYNLYNDGFYTWDDN